MLTKDLNGPRLARLVAKAMGLERVGDFYNDAARNINVPIHDWRPDKNWAQTGMVRDRLKISLRDVDDRDFKGKIIIASIEPQYPLQEDTPLATGAGWWQAETAQEAICRCAVASLYGNEVPDGG